jgi:hypothetical protein
MRQRPGTNYQLPNTKKKPATVSRAGFFINIGFRYRGAIYFAISILLVSV